MNSILGQDVDYPIDHLILNGDEGGGHRYDLVTIKYAKARLYALENGYDAIWTTEYDMIMPNNALRLLYEVESDITYGLYCWRWKPYYWSSYIYLDQYKGISISQNARIARDSWGKVVDSCGVGHGCTLIHRSALERMVFRREGEPCADWFMSLDAQRLGLKQKSHLGVVCGHMSYTPTPTVIWPDPSSDDLFRIEPFIPSESAAVS